MTLKASVVAKLEADYRAGVRCFVTAKGIGASNSTVDRYFARFRDLRIPRGAVKPTRRKLSVTDGVAYTGPTWIGKPITNPPIEAGPNWIGQRIPFRHAVRHPIDEDR